LDCSATEEKGGRGEEEEDKILKKRDRRAMLHLWGEERCVQGFEGKV
jgi:hypothetical protein